jgi:hypothetical protein
VLRAELAGVAGLAGEELAERVEASLERIARSALLIAWMVRLGYGGERRGARPPLMLNRKVGQRPHMTIARLLAV